MPDPTVPEPQPAGRQPTIHLHATLQGLDAAHTTVTTGRTTPSLVNVKVGTPSVSVSLLDDRAAVRQVLTDALAQLDAIDAQGGAR